MKRKWMMVLGLLPLLMGIPPSHHLDAAPGLYLSKAGMALPAGTVAQEAAQSGIIFFGEEHTNALSHKREFELLTELYRLVPDRLVLSLEMFEKDVQASLDAYLAGRGPTMSGITGILWNLPKRRGFPSLRPMCRAASLPMWSNMAVQPA